MVGNQVSPDHTRYPAHSTHRTGAGSFSVVLPLLLAGVLLLMIKMGSATSTIGAEADHWPVTDPEGKYLAYQEGNRWINWWSRGRPGVIAFLTRAAFASDHSGIPDSEQELNQALPVREPYWMSNGPEFARPGIRATWLGHASVLAEVDGTTVLADPIFSERASAVQWAGPQRYRPPACNVSELPAKLDAVVISHTHYDHLDYGSVQALHERYGPKLQWYVPSGVGEFLRDAVGVEAKQVHDMVWWQEETLPGSQTKLVLTPSNHWGRRGIMDENRELWGSWAVIGPQHRFWFGGDTAYCDAFTQIGRHLGPFHLSAIPIGAYYPEWFMKWVHVNPAEAVLMHKDLQSHKSMGIHWGTFKLTKEYYLEPRERIRTLAANDTEVGSEGFQVVNIGETVE
eukprot:maker-scaffold25_size650667-snap-gene-1.22 protein:Tk06694 transcript:maker-scaffold25_size650667-snap-gene-1.22-mRNA-1 annotation:"n-acyl-phosphatidylethanolamine-hydrolyzing phospholipase d"